VEGAAGTFLSDLKFHYVGENYYIDRIAPLDSSSTCAMTNAHPFYECAIAHDAGHYRTFGANFELGGLEDGAEATKRDLVDSIMGFFGIEVGDSPTSEIVAAGRRPRVEFCVRPTVGSGCFEIDYSVPRSPPGGARTRIEVYDVLGRRITTLPTEASGTGRILWDGRDSRGRAVPSGNYFITVFAGAGRQRIRVLSLKNR
jgi:hypothetical protein